METLGNKEISLYNRDGEAVAYIAMDLTIYLWSGEPVAYLTEYDARKHHLYGFNGKHLGWLAKGVLYNHQGETFGAFRSAYTGYTKMASLKSLKALKSLKSLKELPPLTPLLRSVWSDVLCETHLERGKD